MLLLLDLKVDIRLELPGNLVGSGVFGHIVVGWARDNQRRARLVDQDVVDFVNDGEVETPLALLHVLGESIVISGGHPHVVAEVVEAKLVVRAVGDGAGVSLLACAGIEP